MNRLETLASPHPVRVDVAAIQQELRNLWKEAAAPGKEEAAPVTRTCLLNLVVWAEGPAEDPALAETLSKVVAAHPARVILLRIDPGAAPDCLEAWLSACCRVAGSGAKQVCSEQITIRAGAGAVRHLPGLASGLSASDLPVALLVPGMPAFEEPAFRRLAEIADRLLLDSALLPPEALVRLARLEEELKRTALGDLHWRRLRPWQDMVAEFFDSPLCQPFLPEIRALQARGGAGSEVSARLLHGWASAALEGRSLGHGFEASRKAPRGQLEEIRMEAGNGKRALFIVEADSKSGCFTARVEMEGTCPVPRSHRPPKLEPWQIICGQLERVGRDGLYDAALSRAAAVS